MFFEENIEVKKSPLIPLDAYLYFPTDEEIKFGKNQKAYRRIYEGQVQFDEFELKNIADFKEYLVKHQHKLENWYNLEINIKKKIKRWTDRKILRFIYANNWKFDKTLKSITFYTEWYTQKIPPKLTESSKQFLDNGLLYVHGRDHRFRPIVIFQAFKINVKTIDLENILDFLTYFLHFIIENLMLPGQVENWVFIIDLNKIGLTDLPLSLLQKIMSYMQNNFRSRLFVMYIIQAPSSVNFMWGMAKGFLEENTQRKIQILKTKIPENLFTHTNKEQIEKKYGGTANDLSSNYWPPIFPSENYFLPNEKKENLLIKKEEYLKRIEQGLLIENKICDAFLIPEKNRNHEKNNGIEEKKENNVIGKEKFNEIPKNQTKKKSNFTKAKSENPWEFEFLTIDDENIKIDLIHYIKELNSQHTKYFLDTSIKKNKKK